MRILLLAICFPLSLTLAQSIPRAPDGKPDLSGLWDHPFVIDMSKDGRNDACGAELKGCSQKGPRRRVAHDRMGRQLDQKFRPRPL